jgi:hypothetical protein
MIFPGYLLLTRELYVLQDFYLCYIKCTNFLPSWISSLIIADNLFRSFPHREALTRPQFIEHLRRYVPVPTPSVATSPADDEAPDTAADRV